MSDLSDLIRRSDAIEAIEGVDWYHQNSRNKDMVNGANSDEHQAWYKADDVYKALKKVPSADRPRGEWDFIGDNMFRCTSCGALYTTQQLNGLRNYDTDPYAPKFCPSCGADMRGDGHEEN